MHNVCKQARLALQRRHLTMNRSPLRFRASSLNRCDSSPIPSSPRCASSLSSASVPVPNSSRAVPKSQTLTWSRPASSAASLALEASKARYSCKRWDRVWRGSERACVNGALLLVMASVARCSSSLGSSPGPFAIPRCDVLIKARSSRSSTPRLRARE